MKTEIQTYLKRIAFDILVHVQAFGILNFFRASWNPSTTYISSIRFLIENKTYILCILTRCDKKYLSMYMTIYSEKSLIFPLLFIYIFHYFPLFLMHQNLHFIVRNGTQYSTNTFFIKFYFINSENREKIYCIILWQSVKFVVWSN